MRIRQWRANRLNVWRRRAVRLMATSIALFATASWMLLEQSTFNTNSLQSFVLNLEIDPTLQNKSRCTAVTTQEEICWTAACFQERGSRIARAFSKRSMDSWCVNETMPITNQAAAAAALSKNKSSWQGLLYVKVPKAASSTTAGIVLSIQRHRHCAVEHVHRQGYVYVNRFVRNSFLLGSVRDPAQRALSAVYYFVVMPYLEQLQQQQQQLLENNATITSTNTVNMTRLVMNGLQSRQGGKTKGKGGYQYNYLSTKQLEPFYLSKPWEPLKLQLNSQQLLTEIHTNVMQSYDFVLVVERMEESVVALAILLGLDDDWREVVLLVASAKVTANNPYLLVRTGRYKHTCQRKQRPNLSAQESATLNAYFDSPEWYWINQADYLLHAAANASLDRTIYEVIGERLFEQKLADFRKVQQLVMEYCGDRILGSGCTNDGQVMFPLEECYENDFGCGYKCVDEALNRMKHG
ncbi:hypothetical protein MPSEU_000544000 [Mayamaea pseudoterrestris]|nr:hypothetical protein MPSEU_000544000 [Mayamaea pseudoterrestris]